MKQYVFTFEQGNANMRQLLGGKGANLAEMTGLGLPVPPGFTISTEACNNYYENDKTLDEEITAQAMAALEGLAPLFVGRPVLMDHKWSAGTQTARIYAAGVEEAESVHRLVLRCYMPRTEQTASTITAIESGILRECSVGCAVERALCSICGADQVQACCQHWPGREYDGRLCVMELDGAKDAYEVSLLPVPAQPGAGIVKSKRYGGQESPEDAGDDEVFQLAAARQEQENMRYGGTEL